MNRSSKKISGLAIMVLVAALSGCEKNDQTFSILSDKASFSQIGEFEVVPQKIDILWVIDNSGSMQTSQEALTQNLNRFISRFQTLQYDFKMAVTTTDVAFTQWNGQTSQKLFRDGIPGKTSSGVRVITPSTPNLSQVFMTNATQGINGNGDERAFASFELALGYTGNSGFRRSDAFLAVIIISDEDDFSATTSSYLNNNYNDSRLIPVAHYKTFLDTFAGLNNHSVNTISILDEACRVELTNSNFTGRGVGQRYNQLADLTGGVKTSLCDNFGDNLQLISDTIINQKLASQFKLGREPKPETIVVQVNGQYIQQDAVQGWTYEAATLTVTFHGNSVPQPGATIAITFDPVAPKN